MTMTTLENLALSALLLFAPPSLRAQSPTPLPSPDRSADELYRLVHGLTVTPRVLVIGMHPDDEDSPLIAWLSRGRNIETAYLSVTRGEAAQDFGGEAAGSIIGGIRTQELLAARRVDGAHQYFTRAYDFGFARNADEVFQAWPRDSVVGDIVAIIRAFRPHVIVAVFPDSIRDGNGQHMALTTLAEQAFQSAADPQRFPPLEFGARWLPAKLYRHGPGIRIPFDEYDRVLGKTYAEVAIESSSQHRSQGLANVANPRRTILELRRSLTRVNAEGTDTSFFDGVDTSFARFTPNAPATIAGEVPSLVAFADSARRALDAGNRTALITSLAQVVRLASDIRGEAQRCRHPSPEAVRPRDPNALCNPNALDLDASIDLVRSRANAALVAAAGISIEASADRELLATHDTASVMITVGNHGTSPVTISGIAGMGFVPAVNQIIIIPPDSSAHVFRSVTGLDDPHLWWFGQRENNRFPGVATPLDGVSRGIVAGPSVVPGVVIPEEMRRTSDVRIAIDVAGASVSTSIGPVMYRYADAQVGLQNRPLAGVPDATFRFPRALEWIPINKPITRNLRVAVKSHTDKPLRLGIGMLVPGAITVDTGKGSVLPKEITLDPREERELVVPLRGMLKKADRAPFSLWGTTAASITYQTGFTTFQRDYLPPIRVRKNSGAWIQGVDITVPPELTVLYVPDGMDDVRSALTQVGVSAREISPEQLLTQDLKNVRAIALASHALEKYPDLAAQSKRLLDFVRDGGTLVIQRGDNATVSSRLFPYPIALQRINPERVVQPDAPVTLLDAKARLLNWPNKLSLVDWSEWVVGRAELVPTTVDSRYARIIETHDADQPANANSILVARVGKGTLIYTTLTLDTQIAGGVPGALRLLVNMLSAGLTPR